MGKCVCKFSVESPKETDKLSWKKIFKDFLRSKSNSPDKMFSFKSKFSRREFSQDTCPKFCHDKNVVGIVFLLQKIFITLLNQINKFHYIFI